VPAPGTPAHRALVAGLLLVVAGLAPETWAGVAMTVTVLAAGAALLVHASRSVDWSVRHTAAVAIGALLSRGTLAFFYYPVVGETSAVPKYAHNVTMLAVVVALGWLALRSRGRAADTAAAGPYRTGPR
jgi:hypothetical protein